ncbi:hypothetical protein ACJX0J_026905, partial [Zea mays]
EPLALWYAVGGVEADLFKMNVHLMQFAGLGPEFHGSNIIYQAKSTSQNENNETHYNLFPKADTQVTSLMRDYKNHFFFLNELARDFLEIKMISIEHAIYHASIQSKDIIQQLVHTWSKPSRRFADFKSLCIIWTNLGSTVGFLASNISQDDLMICLNRLAKPNMNEDVCMNGPENPEDRLPDMVQDFFRAEEGGAQNSMFAKPIKALGLGYEMFASEKNSEDAQWHKLKRKETLIENIIGLEKILEI